ncbi:hypothetical protein MD484_g5430, partial [Candolleomyces efflorescens]
MNWTRLGHHSANFGFTLFVPVPPAPPPTPTPPPTAPEPELNQNSSIAPLLCPNSNCLILPPCTSKNLAKPGPVYEKSALTTERFRRRGMAHVERTWKVALSRVTFRERRAGRERGVVWGVEEEQEEEEEEEEGEEVGEDKNTPSISVNLPPSTPAKGEVESEEDGEGDNNPSNNPPPPPPFKSAPLHK